MQSQPERLVMENLCTYSPLLPPHLINNALIYYLHFEVFLHGNAEKQAGKKRLIVHCLSVFSITTPTMDHLSVRLGTLWYLCHCKEMKTVMLWENKSLFLVAAVPCRCETNYSEPGIYMAFQDQNIFPALTSGAFNTNPVFFFKCCHLSQLEP